MGTAALADHARSGAVRRRRRAFDLPSLYVPGVALALLWAGSLVLGQARRARGADRARARAGDRGRGRGVSAADPDPPRARAAARRRWPIRCWRARWRSGRPFGSGSQRSDLTLRFPRRGRRRLEPAILTVRDPLGPSRARAAQRARGARCWSCRGSSRCWHPRTAAAAPMAGCRTSRVEVPAVRRSTLARSTSRSTAFAPTARAAPRPASTGRRWRGPAISTSAGWSPAPSPRRSSCSTRRGPTTRTRSTGRCGRPPRSACTSPRSAGGCALLLPGESRAIRIDPQLRAWPDAHARLALVEARGGAPAVARALRAEAVFWVTARGGERPGRGAAALAARIAFLVTPSPVRGLHPSFTVAGCHGQALASPRRRRVSRARAAA